MAISLIDKIKQKNNGTFKLVDAVDIAWDDTKSLVERVEEIEAGVGPKGEDGKSAYELWVAQEGNAGKTEADFFASLKGDKGDKGADGAPGEKGADGAPGEKGEKGAKGDPFTLAKTYDSIANMNAAIGTENDVPQGSFVVISSNVEDPDNAKMYVRGADAFTYISDLSGAEGIKGDTGEKGADGAPGEKGADGAPGAKGADGQSAFALWLTQEGNAGKTEADFLASLKGEKGDTGEKGADGAPGAPGEKGEPGTYTAGDNVTIADGVISVSIPENVRAATEAEIIAAFENA